MSISTRNRLLACFAAFSLAGCASGPPPGPAPVEVRTRPQPSVSPPAQALAPKPASRPAAAPPAASQPVATSSAVRTEPVRSAGVQVRPLEARPLPAPEPAKPDAARPDPARSETPKPESAKPEAAKPETPRSASDASRQAVEQKPAGAGEAIRNQPQGLKRPYSEAALAELRTAPDPATAAESARTESAAKPEQPSESRPEPRADASRTDTRKESAAGYVWPARGKVIQVFAEPRSMGIAIAGSAGDPVVAVADGRVIFSGPGPRGYGNLLIVKHDAETLSVYAHNRALLARDGVQVKRGQQIAELGESGADRPKLHFEIRRGGRPVDPLKLLPPQ